ncbi:N-acetylmuramoyl-L-alanine amidase (plasmid) [Pediococcus parvulus]|uniref:N-acetylmuramoyl-L-alanine amidase n=1 Tax=Pediococcus parvulus TaxID=54062 RepID=A0ABX2UE25_9LACO|nr:MULTISPECIES: N-acetylmuramoyl-L-alanine amidase [Pediococcus]MDV7720265.1 SH3 domain-containing protein [Pediococcus ethanolidurans]OAD63450.1 N-acetylmuramoyl-L-alanine amidase [Pediococcus parvulus]
MTNRKIAFWKQPLVILRVIIIVCIIFIIGYLTIQHLCEPKVTAQAINLRETPAPSSHIIKKISYGTRLRVKQKNPHTKWWHVKVGHSQGWIASWLIHQTHYRATNPLSEATVVLDPGHGGVDSGTIGIHGAMEKTYTLPTALAVDRLLKSKYTRVIMTRASDKSVSLSRRPKIANTDRATLFISFHFNSAGKKNAAQGFEVFRYHHNANNLAQKLDADFVNLPLVNRGIAFGDFEVLRDNHRPAVLVEMGFMDSTHDFKHIKTKAYQSLVAHDVVKGITQYIR